MVSMNKRVLKLKLFFFISFILFQVSMINYGFMNFSILTLIFHLFFILRFTPKKWGGKLYERLSLRDECPCCVQVDPISYA